MMKHMCAKIQCKIKCKDTTKLRVKTTLKMIIIFSQFKNFPKKEPRMPKFDYEALAELYPSRRYAKSQQTQYRRFDRAADAIRYVIEEMPGTWLAGSRTQTT